ncbi:hypothetical protein [Bacteroides fragilis]|uniref:hypothetical protein n=1 Tax=Bacteroides fragilis TaxID=817 RepID=UPI0004B4B4D5|nr:hypothetical protein [Bacteroides fragilis]
MGKEKAGEEKGHIIILYRGNLSGRGKRGFAEKGRGKGHFGEEKGCLGKKIAEGIENWREINKKQVGIDGN